MVWSHLFLFLVSISSILRESSSSYAASPSSIINPSKAKQVSWKPRSISLSLSLSLSLTHTLKIAQFAKIQYLLQFLFAERLCTKVFLRT